VGLIKMGQGGYPGLRGSTVLSFCFFFFLNYFFVIFFKLIFFVFSLIFLIFKLISFLSFILFREPFLNNIYFFVIHLNSEEFF